MRLPSLTYRNLQDYLDYYNSIYFHKVILSDLEENLDAYCKAGFISAGDYELYEANLDFYFSTPFDWEFEDIYYWEYRRRLDGWCQRLLMRVKSIMEEGESEATKYAESFYEKAKLIWRQAYEYAKEDGKVIIGGDNYLP